MTTHSADELELSDEVKAKILRRAEARGTTANDLMERLVDADADEAELASAAASAEYLEAIDEGRRSLRENGGISHRDLKVRVQSRLEARRKRSA